MPLDVLGCTRATLTSSTSLTPWPMGLGNLLKACRAGDRSLQLLVFNEEFLVSAIHQIALITSLPFVHQHVELFTQLLLTPGMESSVHATPEKKGKSPNTGQLLKIALKI